MPMTETGHRFCPRCGTALAAGMPVALLLSERIPWKMAFRVIALIPWMFPVVVVGVLGAWLYHPQFGLFNVLLRLVHLPDQTPVTDAEVNAYFQYSAKGQIPAGIVDPQIVVAASRT